MTAAFVNTKVNDNPSLTVEYIGSSGDASGGEHLLLQIIYRISSFMSYISIWATTVILMNSYREKLTNSIICWIIFSIPLVYFLITYFYQFILSNLLISYLEIDPITVSIVLGAFLSLSRPIGGVLFGIAFWKMSKGIRYEKNIKNYMIISGWGILLIFSANQAEVQIVSPYPPFGVVTVTVLNIAALLILLGIYNSAILVSTNSDLRRSIHKYALESKLSSPIGQAEMENELEKTVKKLL